jgi:hypothetical protein
VKAGAKQITEAKSASKLLKKQSTAIVTKGVKAKLAAAGNVMYQGSVIKGFRSGQTKEISLAIAKLFHGHNIPVSVASSKVFREMVLAIKVAVPPNRAAIDGELFIMLTLELTKASAVLPELR